MQINRKLIWLIFCGFIFSGCSTAITGPEASLSIESVTNAQSLNLIATTGQVNSALQRITDGVNCDVKLFCGPGVDPHSFSASPNDVQAMINADQIFYNGFHLEAKLAEHLEAAFKDKSWAMSNAFPKSERLDWIEDGAIDPQAPNDPHIWNHLPAWSKCVEAMVERLAKLDPGNAVTYRRNGQAYVDELLETHRWAQEKLSELPQNRRTIISAHDAFGYFARNYGMTTGAPLGVGNDAEADIKTMRKLAETICEKQIPAIFVETITNQKVSQALSEACAARGWSVEVVERPLYSDDLGPNYPQNTFIGAFKSNVEVIFDALSQERRE